jgi:hypothetical protein
MNVVGEYNSLRSNLYHKAWEGGYRSSLLCTASFFFLCSMYTNLTIVGSLFGLSPSVEAGYEYQK